MSRWRRICQVSGWDGGWFGSLDVRLVKGLRRYMVREVSGLGCWMVWDGGWYGLLNSFGMLLHVFSFTADIVTVVFHNWR